MKYLVKTINVGIPTASNQDFLNPSVQSGKKRICFNWIELSFQKSISYKIFKSMNKFQRLRKRQLLAILEKNPDVKCKIFSRCFLPFTHVSLELYNCKIHVFRAENFRHQLYHIQLSIFSCHVCLSSTSPRFSISLSKKFVPFQNFVLFRCLHNADSVKTMIKKVPCIAIM